MPTVFTKGRVESVVVLHQANGLRLVRIRILQERIPELGDKFGSRHGQKGTMGMIIPAENMPHTASGIIPDIIVNPHGLTSRMTVAQLLECLFGRFGAEIGAKCNGTAFFNRENIVDIIGKSLKELGLHPHTENLMYCGTTGKQLQCSVFMGPLYFMRMKHLTSDKINSRGEGRREIRTHQPTGGRGNEGGMRIGEMERDAVSAHGVSLFLQESMMKRSDGTNFYICNGCGTVPIYNEKEGLFVCPMCDGPLEFSGSTEETLTLIQPLRRSRVTFSKVEMPYALKLLDQEVTTYTGTGLRFITEKSVGRLRDSVLNWTTDSGPETPLVQQGGLYLNALDNDSSIIEETPPVPIIGGSTPYNYLVNPPSTGIQYADAQNNKEPDAIVSDESYPVYEKNKDVEVPVTVEPLPSPSSALEEDGQAPVESIGKDLVREMPVSPEPQILQNNIEPMTGDELKGILKKQNGGSATIAESTGSTVNQATFYNPSLATEPYVVANPYTNPPIKEPDTVVANEPVYADSALIQDVNPNLIAEVQNTVQSDINNVVFENSEIRVVKLG
jgi:hypothetical protein